MTTGLDGTSTNLTGNLTGANLSLTKIGAGVLSLRGSANTAGSTAGTLTINGGGVTLDGTTTSTLNFVTGYVVNASGTLTLNNSVNNFNNRLSGGGSTFRALTLGGGTLSLNGNSAVNTAESFRYFDPDQWWQHDDPRASQRHPVGDGGNHHAGGCGQRCDPLACGG